MFIDNSLFDLASLAEFVKLGWFKLDYPKPILITFRLCEISLNCPSLLACAYYLFIQFS